MRRIGTAILAVLAITAAAASTGAATALAAPRSWHGAGEATGYYLSLGDSLSQGVQPDASGQSVETRQGYPDQLFAALRLADRGLRLVKLGCPGETTTSMINGGICPYAAGSQLAAARAFLHAHSGQVSLITIDVGANDLNPCVVLPSPDQVAACVQKVIPQAIGNLATIMAGLRAAASSAVKIIGMTYYVPELAAWLTGPAGQALARVSEQLGATYNSLLAGTYRQFGARVADVFRAFRSSDFHPVTVPGLGIVPRNVALVCAWTWECAQPPRGPNEHPNVIGYAVIALTFLLADLR